MIDTEVSAPSAPAVPPDPPPQTAAEFVLTHHGWLRVLAARAARRLAREFEDVLQDLFVWALRAHSRYDPARGTPANFLAWVARSYLAHEMTAAQCLKRTAPSRAEVDARELAHILEDRHAVEPGAELTESEHRAALATATAAALETLPDEPRELVRTLFGIGRERVSGYALAKREGVSTTAVYLRRDAAVRALRAHLYQFVEG